MLFAMLNVETGKKVNFNLNVPHNFPPDSYSLTRSFCVLVFFYLVSARQNLPNMTKQTVRYEPQRATAVAALALKR